MKIKNIIVVIMLTLVLLLSACTFDTGETDEKETIKISFSDFSFSYDGKPHSIEVTGLPEGYTVTYENNGQTEVGNYSVTATVKDSEGNTYKVLSAMISITPCEKHVDSDKDNKCDICGSAIIDLSGIVFEGYAIAYDGKAHSVYAVNIPSGVFLEYSGNNQIKVGMHVITLCIKDTEGNRLATLVANLNITPCENHTDEDLDNKCDICGAKVKDLTEYQQMFTMSDMTIPYDGKEHNLAAISYSTYSPLLTTITYENNGQTEVGVYTVTATIKNEDGIVVKTLTATLTITECNHEDLNKDNYCDKCGTKLEENPVINYAFSLNSQSFEYDGASHSLLVVDLNNPPVSHFVAYTNNNQTEVGVYTVTAVVKDKDDNILKELTATLTITECSHHKDLNDDNKCDICGKELEKIDEPIDVSMVTLTDMSVTYDKNAHSLEVNNLPEGVLVTYTGNNQSEVGSYTVIATLKDSKDNTLKTLNATLTITECVDHKDENGDNKCDICGKVLVLCDVHEDLDDDLYCDICGFQLEKRFHLNDDGDDFCDKCGARLVMGIDGIYLLKSKTTNNVNTTNENYADYIELTNKAVNWYKASYASNIKQEGTFSVNGSKVTIEIGVYSYDFTYDEENKTLSFSGRMNQKNVTALYELSDFELDKNDKGTVDFTDELFGDDIDKNFYNYCPTIMMEGNNIMHIYYCSNKDDGNVTDYIAYRKGVLHEDMKWVFSNKQIVLSPGITLSGKADSTIWDSRHCCDPAVVKGSFNYNGDNYQYLMAYLGCYTSDCSANEVGIAVAKSPAGPWYKVGDQSKAFISYFDSSDYVSDGGWYWGYGQPSLVSVDKEGTVLLFYTKGIKIGTFIYCEKWDFSDLNHPVKLAEQRMPNGINNSCLNNADFAYDPVTKTVYCLGEDHTYNPTDGGVDWLVGGNILYSYSLSSSETHLFDSFFTSFQFEKVGVLNEKNTGFARNHNMGIVTDEYGWLQNSEYVPVVYTMSYLLTDYPDWSKGGQWPALHTYRLHGYTIYVG